MKNEIARSRRAPVSGSITSPTYTRLGAMFFAAAGRHSFFRISIAFGPESLTIATAPAPLAVAGATMVSVGYIPSGTYHRGSPIRNRLRRRGMRELAPRAVVWFDCGFELSLREFWRKIALFPEP